MTPFHYSVVQCRDFAVPGERRNVALLVAAPAQRKVWLRRGDLKGRAHLIGDDAAFVRAVLDVIERDAQDVAREGSARVMHAWLRSHALPTEDVLAFTAPAMGVAVDVKKEAARLSALYLGKGPSRSAPVAEKVVGKTLRDLGVAARFAPHEFASGPATWRFPKVADTAGAPLVVNALTFDQTTPEKLLDAAFKNVGRAGEVNAFQPGVRWVTVAAATAKVDEPAFRRACQLMDGAGLGVVAPDEAAISAALKRELDGRSTVRRA